MCKVTILFILETSSCPTVRVRCGGSGLSETESRLLETLLINAMTVTELCYVSNVCWNGFRCDGTQKFACGPAAGWCWWKRSWREAFDQHTLGSVTSGRVAEERSEMPPNLETFHYAYSNLARRTSSRISPFPISTAPLYQQTPFSRQSIPTTSLWLFTFLLPKSQRTDLSRS